VLEERSLSDGHEEVHVAHAAEADGPDHRVDQASNHRE
jgi:hypothetical protein